MYVRDYVLFKWADSLQMLFGEFIKYFQSSYRDMFLPIISDRKFRYSATYLKNGRVH